MPPFPGFLQSLGLIAIGLGAAFLTLIIAGVPGTPPTALILISSVVGSTVALGVGLLLARRPLRNVLRLGRHARAGWDALPMILVGSVVLVSELDNLVLLLWPPPSYFSDVMQQIMAPERPLDRALALVLAGFMAPVAEEFLFRGLIQQGLSARHGASIGIAFSALLFATYHLNPWQGGTALALGALFGWVAHRSGLIAYSIALHLGNNLIAIALARAATPIPGLTPLPEQPAHVPPALLLAAAAILVWGLARFAKAFPLPASPQEADPGLLDSARARRELPPV